MCQLKMGESSGRKSTLTATVGTGGCKEQVDGEDRPLPGRGSPAASSLSH